MKEGEREEEIKQRIKIIIINNQCAAIFCDKKSNFVFCSFVVEVFDNVVVVW